MTIGLAVGQKLPSSCRRAPLLSALAASAAAHALLLAALLAGAVLLPAAPLPADEHLASVDVVMGGGAERSGSVAEKEQTGPPAPRPLPQEAAAKPQPSRTPSPPQLLPAAPQPLPAPPPSPPAPERTATAAPAPAATPVPATAPAPKPAPPRPTWQTGPLFGDGTVGAAALFGSALRPAKGDKGNIPPAYPLLSAELGEQGVVVVELFITADGHVAKAVVTQTSGYPRLDQAAQTALSRWHFTPAVRDGEPVPSRLLLPVRFRLH